MAIPKLEFGSINLSSATVYSTASNNDSFIRVRATYVNGSNSVQVTDDVAGYFGTGSIESGYFLRSVGEVSTPTKITNWNSATKVITLDGTADSSGTNQLTRISLPQGKLFIESASFQKIGGSSLNPPNDFRDVTGSSDAEYQAGDFKWGIIGQLAATSSISDALAGLYAQYELTSFVNWIDVTTANIMLTASDTINAFKEPEGYSLARQDAISSLFLSEISGSFMTIAGSNDISGNQSLGLAAYQNVVASTIALFTSASNAFPFSGSAEITGSLTVTGSSEFIIPVGGVNDNFIIASGSGASQERVLNVTSEGVVQFFAQDNSYTPTAVLGGIYFTSASAFIGVE